jgi:hypothetical protein
VPEGDGERSFVRHVPELELSADLGKAQPWERDGASHELTNGKLDRF